nr:neuraminidase-like domain-containing protein [uncultured Desulfobacter sp.]
MKEENYTLSGKVIGKDAKAGIQGLRIEAWDNDLFFDDCIGAAESGEDGGFEIRFDAPHFREWLSDRNPDLYFKVYSGDTLLQTTSDDLLWHAGRTKNDVVIQAPMEAGMEPHLLSGYAVRGVVRNPRGSGLPGLVVRVFDRDMRSEQLLGKAKTDADGKYEIEYSRNQFDRVEKKTADLAVKVFGPTGEQLLHDPNIEDIVFNARDRAKVNIVINTAITPAADEYTLTDDCILPLLEKVDVATLRETKGTRDISFLNRETGIDRLQLEHFVVAHRLHQKTDISSVFFYALLRKNSILKLDSQKLWNIRFRIDLNTDIHPLIFEIALLDDKIIYTDVNAAMKEMIIPDISEEELKRILVLLKKYKAEAEEYQQKEKPRRAVELITNVLMSDKLPELVKNFGGKNFDFDALVDYLAENKLLDDKLDKKRAGASIALADILGFDKDIIDSIRKIKQIKKPEDVETLAAMNRKEWSALLEASAADITLAGKPIDKRIIDRHASKLVRRFEKQFPTTAYVSQLKRESKPTLKHHARLAALLSEHPEFKLESTGVDAFFNEKGIDIQSNRGAIKELKRLQRVFKLIPHYSKTNSLMAQGLTSSQSIVATGRSRFINKIAPRAGLTVKEANEVFAKAENINTASMFIMGDVQEMISGSPIAALKKASLPAVLEAVGEDFPDLKTLFKQADMCTCEHCRSVYSPAAYLVELLQFLDKRSVVDRSVDPPVEGYLAKNVLFDRRPDIGDLDLNCANAQTPLPYIDLVCEVLEAAVFPDQGIPINGVVSGGAIPPALKIQLEAGGLVVSDAAVIHEPDSQGNFILRDEKLVCKMVNQGAPTDFIAYRLHQTFGSAQELAAAPEYVNSDAYDRLAVAEFAFGLPFDLNHVESMAYFSRFNISRAELMDSFHQGGSPSPQEIAAEKLGLTPAEHDLIKLPQPAAQEGYWNIPAVDIIAEMEIVDTMLTRTGLSYKDLAILLQLKFINPAGSLFIKHEDLACDTTQKRIENLDEDALDRIHRFMRIRNKTGWSLELQDELLSQPRLGNNDLNGDGLVNMANLVRVSELSNMKLDQLIGCYGDIPHEQLFHSDDIPLYQRIFLNKAANGVIDDALLPENIGVPALLGEDVNNSIAAALQISLEDLNELIDGLSVTDLTFENLSALYGHSLLSRKLSVSVAELLLFIKLTGLDAFNSPAVTLEFVKTVIEAKTSPLAIEDMKFMLTHDAPDLDGFEISEDTIISILSELQKGYQEAFKANQSAFSTDLTSQEMLADLKAALLSLPQITEAAANTFVEMAKGDFALPASDGVFISEQLDDYFDTTDVVIAQAHLANTDPLAADYDPEADRLAMIRGILDGIADYFFQAQQLDQLVTVMTAAFNVEEELANAVIDFAEVRQLAAVNSDIAVILTTSDLIDRVNTEPVLPLIDAVTFGEQYAAIRLLHKLFPLAGSLELSADDVSWLLENCEDLSWMKLDGIPYEAGQTPIPYQSWLDLMAIVDRLKSLTPVADPMDAGNPISFQGLMELLIFDVGTPTEEWLDLLALLTGYDREGLENLNDRFGYSTPDLGAYLQADTWNKIDVCMAYQRKLSVSIGSVAEFIKPRLTAADTIALRIALKARYSDATWLTTLSEIMDTIRPQKRDALVAFLLAVNPEINDQNDLYDYFLVDTQMEACMPSSRIVQAHGVVQLFVQRCLLGIEPGAAADVEADTGWEQWQWMRMYRVWEANRKVFVYPENWIEPELLTDKSYLFSDLENELLQNELNEFTTEDAIANYLEKLDDIAFLEVVACWYQEEQYTMHVFARTKGGDPAQYFYRTFENERYWTPWQKVDLDITSDHLLAFIRNRRLYLAWPVFSDENDPDQEVSTPAVTTTEGSPQPMNKGDMRTKIQLAVSEYANGVWKPKKISQEAITTPVDYSTTYTDPKTFSFFYERFLDRITVFHSLEPDYHILDGHFSLNGCKGYPEVIEANSMYYRDFYPDFESAILRVQRYLFQQSGLKNEGLALRTTFTLFFFVDRLNKTPNGYKATYPHQFSLLDLVGMFFQLVIYMVVGKISDNRGGFIKKPLGTGMPYFVEDSAYGYAVIPGLYGSITDPATGTDVTVKRTFSNILKLVEDIMALVREYLTKLTATPAPSLDDWMAELIADQDYQDIMKEINIYRQLHPKEEYKNMYHPLVCDLRKTFYKEGVPGLMKRETQMTKSNFSFDDRFDPQPTVQQPYPVEDVDFNSDGAYSSYNWEMFYHAPLMIAMRLSKDQKFEQALEWFHFMFNPTGVLDGPVPQKYWVTKPFFQATDQDYINQRIDNLLYHIADPTTPERAELEFAIGEWRENPFMPHTVARFRPVAYQKALLMKYLDNLIAWGDYNFGQDTMESIAQATQYYVLAEKLLGPKPRVVDPPVAVPAQTYYQIENSLQDFGNALVAFENMIPDLALLPREGAELPPAPITLSSLYFCVPQNEKILEYWGIIEDRLFKIRNCQNIDGVERSLALFAPPIDPGMLVRAAAAGLSLSSILSGMGAPRPHYRFERLSQKATELIQEVRVLGSSLLQALEKKDAESLSLLRSELEHKVLASTREMKLLQISEAAEQIEVLNKNREITQERNDYYANIEAINANEQLNLDKLSEAHVFQTISSVVRATGGVLGLIPDFSAGGHGAGGSPAIHATWGGSFLAEAASAAAGVLDIFSGIASYEASRASTLGSYDRRSDDWSLQERVTGKEMVHIDQQIIAAEIRKEIAEADLKNHDLQIENNEKINDFMHSKYTNKDLYTWMVGQITSVYFQAYKLSYDMAKKAEQSYQYELGSTDTFMEFGYWDSLKKGLLSADHLLHDLKRMEVRYLDNNKREYELTKHVSLSMLDPLALVRLRATGVCDFTIPEALYDMDHPGHYFRRIKSISISLPCIAGPYTSVSGKLSELSNKYRKTIAKAAGAGTPKEEYEENVNGDTRFVYNIGSIQSLATSSSQNDSGLFQLDFNDERFLPFEGTGAVGTWRFELPTQVQQFDYQSITDLIVHVKYTAREGGSTLQNLAQTTLKDKLMEISQALEKTGMHRYHSLRYEMPNEWNLLKTEGVTNVTLTKAVLPYFVQPLAASIAEIIFIARVTGNPETFTIKIDQNPDLVLPENPELGLCLDVTTEVVLDTTFSLSSIDVNLDALEDLAMVIKYTFT